MWTLRPWLLCLLPACAATVPRPEPLAEEPLDEATPPPAPARARGKPAPAPVCLSKALAGEGRVQHARKAGNDIELCLRPEGADDDVRDSCFAWSLTEGAFRKLETRAPESEPTPTPPTPSKLRATKDSLSVCDDAGKCSTLVNGKNTKKTEAYRLGLDDRIDVRASSDGKTIALVRQLAGGGEGDGQIETYDLVQKRLVKRFRVTSPGHGDQVGALEFVGPLLLVQQCDAGPACTGRLFDPATGQVRLDVPVNFYGSRWFALDEKQWLFVDGWLEGALVIEVESARVVKSWKSGLAGPAEDAGRILFDGSELFLIYSGSGESPEASTAATLVRIALGEATPKRYAAPVCLE